MLPQYSVSDFAAWRDLAVSLCKSCGPIATTYQCRRKVNSESFKVDSKQSHTDLVTEADKSVESAIKQAICAKYPHHKFVGEETQEGIKSVCFHLLHF